MLAGESAAWLQGLDDRPELAGHFLGGRPGGDLGGRPDANRDFAKVRQAAAFPLHLPHPVKTYRHNGNTKVFRK